MEKNMVTVKGSMDPQKLVEFISKRSGRNAEIVKKTNKKATSDDIESKGSKQTYPQELVYAPQLFSDENPNACSIMWKSYFLISVRVFN